MDPRSVLHDLHGRKFTLVSNTAGNAVAGETTFAFEQAGEAVRVSYSGGGIQLGAMVGKFVGANRLHVMFQQVTTSGDLKVGDGDIAIERDPNGKLRFIDDWRFLMNGEGGGRAVWTEI